MILERQSVEYTGNTKIQKKSFTVADTVLISDLLSNMYTNPILACVREYLFNAIDSHFVAKKPINEIKITCPTMLHQYFEIQDFGIGMSEDEVYELMTSYGSSSKRHTNDLVGSYGIGSKAAFAYARDFMFISIKDQIKSSYLCFIDGENGPQIDKLSSIKTDEPNGVTIKIRVKPVDLTKFQTEIQNVCQWLDEQPKIIGYQLKPLEFVYSGDGFRFFHATGSRGWSGQKTYIRMGGIVYDTSVIYHKFYSPIVVDFPIGAFKLAPSRESIINTTDTTKIIIDKLNQIYTQLSKQFWDELKQQPTLHRARLHYHNYNSKLFSLPNFKYSGNEDTYFKTDCINKYNPYRVQGVHKFKRSIQQCQAYDVSAIALTKEPAEKPIKYVDKLQHYEHTFGVTLEKVPVLHGTPRQQLKQWIRIGKPDVPIINLDNYELPKSTSVRQNKQLSFSEYDQKTKQITKQNISINDNVVHRYFIIANNRIDHWLLTEISWYYSSSEFQKMVEFFGIIDNIVLVPKTLSHRVPKNWINLVEHVDRSINDYVEIAVGILTRNDLRTKIQSIPKKTKLIRNSFGRFIKRLDKLITKIGIGQEKLEIPNFLSSFVSSLKLFVTRGNLINVMVTNRINADYPLLFLNYNSLYQSNNTHYIQLINNTIDYERLLSNLKLSKELRNIHST